MNRMTKYQRDTIDLLTLIASNSTKTYEINRSFSSSTVNGATHKTSLGNYFTVTLTTPIKIPIKARNIKLSVPSASIENTVHNIVDGQNKLYLTYNDGGGIVAKTLTIPAGLYGFKELNDTVNRLLIEEGWPSLISITADVATEKIIIVRNFTLITIDFTQADSIYEIIGFPNANIVSNATAPFYNTGVSKAKFNKNTTFIIKSNIISEGITTNNKIDGVLAKIPVDVNVGITKHYNPEHPAEIPANDLAGTSLVNLEFTVVNQLFEDMNMGDEDWELTIRIKYDI